MVIKWQPTTQERYGEMLGVLPPASMSFDSHNAFQVGEAFDHRNGIPTFATFKVEGNQYYESDSSHTFAEFKAEFPDATYSY